MKKLSVRTRIVTAAAGLAVVGAGTAGALTAHAATEIVPPAAAATATASTASRTAAPAAAVNDSGKGLVQTEHLSVASAQKAASAALESAEKAGQHVTVAVVDRNGNTIVVLRGDGAGPQSYTSAQEKAYTSVAWNAPTSVLAGRLAQTPELKDIPGTLFLAGGAPIAVSGAPVAAVGVAGAPSGAQDETFAQAGVAALGK